MESLPRNLLTTKTVALCWPLTLTFILSGDTLDSYSLSGLNDVMTPLSFRRESSYR